MLGRIGWGVGWCMVAGIAMMITFRMILGANDPIPITDMTRSTSRQKNPFGHTELSKGWFPSTWKRN